MRVGDRLVALNGAEIGEAAGASLGEMLSAAGWWGAQGAGHGRRARVALLVLRGEARWGWSHSIAPRMTDPAPPSGGGATADAGELDESRRMRRGKRYSLTSREAS